MVGDVQDQQKLYRYWQQAVQAPYVLKTGFDLWQGAMFNDRDADGGPLFDGLMTKVASQGEQITGFIQYGYSAFAFGSTGNKLPDKRYPIIRQLYFEPQHAADGQALLQEAMDYFARESGTVYAFFHYFGLSCCARHGKLYEKYTHIEDLLFKNGFVIEHQNYYYSMMLSGRAGQEEHPWFRLEMLPGEGEQRNFLLYYSNSKVGGGTIAFLPQQDVAYLRWLYIHHEYQGKGYGVICLNLLLDQLAERGIQRLDVDTSTDNRVAQRFYQKNGFHFEGITRSYYRKPAGNAGGERPGALL